MNEKQLTKLLSNRRFLEVAKDVLGLVLLALTLLKLLLDLIV